MDGCYILFDLDNTLYSPTSGMAAEIERRMSHYVAALLDVAITEASRLRHYGFVTYGTTLAWLRAEHRFDDVDDYLAAVHPQKVGDFLQRDAELPRLLRALPLRMSVLTNSPLEHAERVLAALGVRDCFDHVFDIRYNEFVGKPHAQAYNGPIAALGKTAQQIIFVDDQPSYVRGFLNVGGTGVLIDELHRHSDQGDLVRIGSLHELPRLLDRLSRCLPCGESAADTVDGSLA